MSCDGWNISTVESLGNKQEGYSVIQNRLVNFHGTQVTALQIIYEEKLHCKVTIDYSVH